MVNNLINYPDIWKGSNIRAYLTATKIGLLSPNIQNKTTSI